MTDLRQGYTLADLHQMTRLAVHTARAGEGDWRERYDTAWSAIAEALYATSNHVERHVLVAAGRKAVHRSADRYCQAHGYFRHKTSSGAASSPAFRTYWLDATRSAGSPEDGVVDQVAVTQIWPTLTEGQRSALFALAVHGSYEAAANALGLSRAAFKQLVSTGRRRFLRRWHQGETPSRLWRATRPAVS
ncbi:hypothetical protein [Micromonospora taraxaci]|uniref:hypothetical protein n=1 Tax=Micromonospora taraxaci TaxID=1316803 RepID=UPI0033B36254